MSISTTNVQNKFLYTRVLCVVVFLLCLSYGFISYFVFNFLDIAFALTLFVGVSLIFTKFFNWLRRTTYLKFKNYALIVKGAFSKTILAPLNTIDVETVFQLGSITLIRLNFALDGIQYSYFSFTNEAGIQMLKKRQAISRVL